MPETRAELPGAEALARAKAAQKRLVEQLQRDRVADVSGIGIGLTADRGAYALDVLVGRKCPTDAIPESVDGVPVILLPVGRIVAIEGPPGAASA